MPLYLAESLLQRRIQARLRRDQPGTGL